MGDEGTAGNEVEPGRLMVYEPRVDGGWRHGWFLGEFRMEPTPADLLTDPRVQALVDALRRVQGDYTIEEEEWRCVDEALAPFGVSRG